MSRPVTSGRGLLDARLLFVAGKGGVGRTAVSCALALAASRKGKRVLLAGVQKRERYSELLGTRPVPDRNTPILPNLEAVHLNPTAALDEVGMQTLGRKALVDLVLHNRLVEAFLRATPGLDDWSMLGKACFHATDDVRRDGSPTYDLVVFDGPATGHALDMLRVPKVIVDAAPAGPLRKDGVRGWTLLTDPKRAGIVLVTLAEDMPANESVELHGTLANLGIPTRALVVNRLLPRVFPHACRDVFQGLPERLNGASPISPLAAAGRGRATREALQQEIVDRLEAALPVDLVGLPQVFTPSFGREAIETLAHALAEAHEGRPTLVHAADALEAVD